MLEGSASAVSEPAGLKPGLVLGGRFEVLERVRDDATGVIWSARDQQTDRKIELRLMQPGLLPKSATAEFREACRVAASLSHRSIARLFGVGRAPGGQQFIAGEWTEGRALTSFITDRTGSGEPLSLRGAYNVIAHICSALLYAQEKTVHGTLRPSAVTVSRGGRVKLRDMGVGLVLLRSVGPQVFKDADHASLAPEVKRGELATPQSDVFGLGAILYLLLTNKLPSEELVPPSMLRGDVTSEVDQILFKCLAADPSERYETAEQVREALLPHLTEANSVPPKNAPAISLDVDLASVLPPTEMKIPSVHAPPPPPSPQLDEQLKNLSKDRKQRWMVTRDKMDHGPFSARELIERVNVGGFEGSDPTFNTETAERKALKEWPEFREFVLAREHQNRLAEEQAARHRARSKERRSSFAIWALALAVLGLLVVGVGAFLLSRSSGAREAASTELDDLYQHGDVPVGEAGILPEKKRGKRRRGSQAGGGAGKSSSGFGSYEDAMNQAVELGDATQGGSEATLTGKQVAGVMNRHLSRIYRRCVPAEAKRNPSMKSVKVDLAIAGTGEVLGASVSPGSAEFQSCMAQQIRPIRFPSFGAPRMGARYRFKVD